MADSDLCVLELVPWDRVGAQPHLLAMVTEHADIVNTTDKSPRYHHHHLVHCITPTTTITIVSTILPTSTG